MRLEWRDAENSDIPDILSWGVTWVHIFNDMSRTSLCGAVPGVSELALKATAPEPKDWDDWQMTWTSPIPWGKVSQDPLTVKSVYSCSVSVWVLSKHNFPLWIGLGYTYPIAYMCMLYAWFFDIAACQVTSVKQSWWSWSACLNIRMLNKFPHWIHVVCGEVFSRKIGSLEAGQHQ